MMHIRRQGRVDGDCDLSNHECERMVAQPLPWDAETKGAGRSPAHRSSLMFGKVIWFHKDLGMGLIERAGGFTVGSVESGILTLGGRVEGDFLGEGMTVIQDLESSAQVTFFVEADAVTEEEANELLGIVRG
ncbi:hypothetical protein L2Y96_12420 [Luteibacter aegosomaticola]|uniref:hypothetical protein n=1 Tax=Luteibacter aegosomaticola TaxID=2911538 RepID=UPI001FFB4C20|nr:hypothetical protein [Luteibacter aegosomaticola]UPG88224.1 hypothetical protein L2Y96_12420 [Luteibacter aegosomaticola]